ncbi:immunoglobulin-like domain-containing protein [Enterococcus avium]|uniref:immunoglobulin-like domain-containing protein n=1 Tax=Enterococcus avium TaxID=33945 RepID=UPI003BF56879
MGNTDYSTINVTNGVFGYYVKNLNPKVGDTITVIGLDSNLNTLDQQEVTVVD